MSAAPCSPSSSSSEDAPSSSSSPSSPRTTTVDEEIEVIGFGRFHAAALAVLGLANASDAVELLCISFVLPRLPADAFSDADRSLLSSAIFVGMLLGGLVFGAASDALGRRTALVLALLINAVFGALSAAAPERPYGALFAMRVLGGFGVGGSIPGVFSMAAELLPRRDRGFYLTLVAWWWMVGSVYAAGAAWLLIGLQGASWRVFALVCAVPAFAAAVLVALLLPESPRYLVLAGRPAAAEAALVYIARWNGADSRLTRGYRLATRADEAATRRRGAAAAADAAGGGLGGGGATALGDGDAARGAAAPGKGGKAGAAAVLAAASAAAAAPAAAFGIGSEDDEEDNGDLGSGRGGGIMAGFRSGAARGGAATAAASSVSVELAASGGASRSAARAAMAAPSGGDDEAEGDGESERAALTERPGGRSGGGRATGPSFWAAPWSWFASDEEAPQASSASSSSSSSASSSSSFPAAASPLAQFFSPQLRRTAVPLMVVWFCLSLGFYGLTLWIPTIFGESDVDLDEFQDAFLVQAANLPGNVASTLLIERLGRRGVLASSLLFACVAAAIFPFARVEWAVVLCACALNAASTAAWNALDCLSTESFPTSLRATAMGVLAATGRLGSVAGQFIFGALVHVNLFALLGVAAAILLIGAAAGAALPRDPKGKRLQEDLEDAAEGGD